MKKFFALALSRALALTAFAGCSSTSASTSTPAAASGSTAGSAGTAASGELNLYTWETMTSSSPTTTSLKRPSPRAW